MPNLHLQIRRPFRECLNSKVRQLLQELISIISSLTTIFLQHSVDQGGCFVLEVICRWQMTDGESGNGLFQALVSLA
jgi:hypothetical protein